MAAPADDTAAKLYRVRRTVCEVMLREKRCLRRMLHDRGYLVTEKERTMSKDEFRDTFGDDPQRDDLMLLKHKRDSAHDEIYVFFAPEPKVNVKTLLQKYCGKMKETNVFKAVLVLQQPLTGIARNKLAEMAPKFTIEVFQEGEMLVNVTRHELVPKHVPLTDDEKRTLLERYTVREAQLPRIQKNDPVARYLGLSKGQVVQIQRISETAGKYINYRLVV